MNIRLSRFMVKVSKQKIVDGHSFIGEINRRSRPIVANGYQF